VSVLGPVKKAFEYTLLPGAEILVANFRADAFYRFFGSWMLAEHTPVNPDDFLDENCFTALWYELKKMAGPTERVDYILEFCKPYLRDRDTITEHIAAFENDSLSVVKTIAKETNRSERSVQLHHKKHLGYSAKEITRYHRFLKAIELIQHLVLNGLKPDWFDIIDQCGYYDQSQLIHDFRHYINLTPTGFLKFQQDICIATPE